MSAQKAGGKPEPVGIGVIGLGFMGRTHIEAYEAARRAGYNCRLVAVCDRDLKRRESLADGSTVGERSSLPSQGAAGVPTSELKSVRTYAEPSELLNDGAVDLVSICTYTDTHAELAIRALEAGKHVLVEKPVALRSADVRRVAGAAAGSKTLCMPAMCMRFWPGWTWLKQQIDTQALGPVRSVVFGRLAAAPTWAADFYGDRSRSGGALVDLHIHDADFIRFCFGDPDAVVSTGSIDHVTTLYRYADGPTHVVAEGGWIPAPGFQFRMRYLAVFDTATAEFDSSRDPPLLLTRGRQAGPASRLATSKLARQPAPHRAEPVPLETLSGWDGEIRVLLDAILKGRDNPSVTMEDAVKVGELLEAELRSLETGESVKLSSPPKEKTP